MRLDDALKTIKGNTLTSIDLSGNDIRAAGAESLASALTFNHTLTSIDLSENSIGAAGAEALASALKSNHTLTSIDLGRNGIGAAGAESLAGALASNHTLTSIDLRFNDIDAAGAKALADALKSNHTLISIVLSGSHIKATEAEVLADALKSNHTLISIDLGWNRIDAAEAKVLANALKSNDTLTSIDLSHNRIDAAGAEALADALKSNDTLISIDLSHNNINAAGAKALADALKSNDTLISVDLSHNNINTVGAEALADALKSNDTLISIDLGWNGIKVVGAESLAGALKSNDTLTSIDLSDNGIKVAGAESLAGTLTSNDTLTSIGLSGNRIDAAGAKALADALKSNDTLTSIDLSDNGLKVAGAKALADALKSNDTLTSIDLGDNGLKVAGAKALADALKSNHTLTSIDLGDNGLKVAGAKALADALKSNHTLISIDLGDNDIDAVGAEALADALKSNDTLTSINLRGNSIDAAGAEVLADALKSNHTLTSIKLRYNIIKKADMKTVLKRLAEALDNNTILTEFSMDFGPEEGWPKVEALLQRNRQAQQEAAQRKLTKARLANVEQRLDTFSAIETARNHRSPTISSLLSQCDAYWRDKATSNEDIAKKALEKLLAIVPGTSEFKKECQQQNHMMVQALLECEDEKEKEKEEIQKLTNEMKSLPKTDENRIAKLEDEIKLHDERLKAIEKEIGARIRIREHCEQLFLRDDESQGNPLRTFHHLMFCRLTSLAIGLNAIQSKLVEIAKGWEDELSDLFSSALGAGVGVALGFVSLGTAAPIIPIAAAGTSMISKKLVGRQRQKSKEKEVALGAMHYGQGVLEFDVTNMKWAYDLTYLLQDKLLYCRPEGVQCIADTLLEHIIYYIMKEIQKKNAKTKQTKKAKKTKPLDNLSSDPSHPIDAMFLKIFDMDGIKQKIKNKFLKRKSVATFFDKNNNQYPSWTLKSVLTKGGYAYAKESEFLFADIRTLEAGKFKTAKFSDPEHYGYFYFHSEGSANDFFRKQCDKINDNKKHKVQMTLYLTGKKGLPDLSSIITSTNAYGEQAQKTSSNKKEMSPTTANDACQNSSPSGLEKLTEIVLSKSPDAPVLKDILLLLIRRIGTLESTVREQSMMITTLQQQTGISTSKQEPKGEQPPQCADAALSHHALKIHTA